MKYKYLMIAAALAVSCTAELDTGTDAVREASLALSRKVVNTKSRQTADDEFLLKFDKVPGVELLDSICAMGAVSVEPVFFADAGERNIESQVRSGQMVFCEIGQCRIPGKDCPRVRSAFRRRDY